MTVAHELFGGLLRGLGWKKRRVRNDAAPLIRRLEDDVEAWLRDIDFEEVTNADRLVFLESVVANLERQAVAQRRFDVAVAIRRFGARRIAELMEEERTPPAGHGRAGMV